LRFVAVCLGSFAGGAPLGSCAAGDLRAEGGTVESAGLHAGAGQSALRRDCELDQPARYCAKRERRNVPRRARRRYA
jgi:hypothetical protein